MPLCLTAVLSFLPGRRSRLPGMRSCTVGSALVAYDKKMDTNKDDPELMLGRMRCLEALGEW